MTARFVNAYVIIPYLPHTVRHPFLWQLQSRPNNFTLLILVSITNKQTSLSMARPKRQHSGKVRDESRKVRQVKVDRRGWALTISVEVTADAQRQQRDDSSRHPSQRH